MSYIKEYILLLVFIFCVGVCWSIDVPQIVKLKLVPVRRDRYKKKIQCIARGNPKPTLYWTFNGTKLKTSKRIDFEQDNSILIIDDVTPKDTGHYRCYASNSYGMIFAQIHLNIKGVGMFRENFRSDDISQLINVTIGAPTVVRCPPHTDVRGHSYTWVVPPMDFLLPGRPIDRLFVSNDHGALYFSYIKEEDVEWINKKGGVSCLLFIDFNNFEASVKIKLQGDGKATTANVKPDMVVFFKNQTIAVEGSPKELRCGATGRPHPEFKWYKNGKLISTDDGTASIHNHIYMDGKGLVMQISKVKKSDEGNYKCVATNSEGSVEQEAHLFVHSKVAFSKRLPPKVNTPVKSPITLECGATAHPAPKYIWYHNNTIITSTARRTIKDGVLKIPVSDFPDCGMYLCTAENYLNTIVSPSYITIEDVPPVFTKKLEEGTYYFLTKKDYTLTCAATGGPEPEIRWYQNDKLIDNTKHQILSTDGTALRIKDVTKAQNGVYKCVAENRKAKIESSATVKVFIKTLITRRPDRTEYDHGYDAYLFCDATYDKTLPVTWQWLKGEKVLTYDDHVYLKDKNRVTKLTKKSHTLKVNGVNVGDAGEYTCKVFTMDGSSFKSTDKATGSITVIAPPLVVGNLRIAGSFDKAKKKKAGDAVENKTTKVATKAPGSVKASPTETPSGDDDDVVLSWTEPNKYVGPAKKYIIEYTKANTSAWKRYDPPKQYDCCSLKLDKDKLPASTDLVFRVKAVAVNNGKDLVGKPSNATKSGSVVTPSRAPKENPTNLRIELDDENKENATLAWDKLDDVDRPGPGFKTVCKFREIDPKKAEFKTFTKEGDDNRVPVPLGSGDGIDKVYEVLVASKNDAGQGPWKRTLLKVPGKKPSVKVGNITLVSVTAEGVKIKWSAVEGATGYRVYYTKKGDRRRRRSAQATMDVKDTTATIKDLKPGAQYEITVAPVNLKGEGPKSDSLDVKTKNGVPDIPNDVSLDTIADTVKVGWGPPKRADVKNYTVTWYPQGDKSKKKTMTVPANEREAFIKDKDMKPDQYYTVEVTANNDEGTGKPWVMKGIVIGEPDVPGKPAPPLANAVNDTKINVTFQLPKNSVGGLPTTFKICYAQDECLTSDYPKKPFVIFESLTHSKTYEFWSVAKNDKGEGEKSDKTSQKPLDPPTTPLPTTTEPPPTNETIPYVVPMIKKATQDDEKAFYEETWFIILLIILLILIIILIVLCIICNRRGGKYPVGKKEKDYGGWDKDPLKDYDGVEAMENGGADMPLITPSGSPDRDSIKKTPIDDDDEDSLADYGEGYGDMGQYGTDTKKAKNGQTVC